MNNAAKKIDAVQMTNKQIDEAVNIGKQTVEKAANATKSHVEKASVQTLKQYEEVANVGKENVDNLVNIYNIVSKGAEEMGRSYFEYAQKQAEAQVESAKTIFQARNANELLDAQNEYVRNSYDKFSAESAKISELSLKLANDIAAPFQNQFNQWFERVNKQISA